MCILQSIGILYNNVMYAGMWILPTCIGLFSYLGTVSDLSLGQDMA